MVYDIIRFERKGDDVMLPVVIERTLVDKDIKTLDDIWADIEEINNDFELSLDTDLRRNTGSYYTGLKLAKHMVDELFDNAGADFIRTLKDKAFLEPCVGTGNFVFAFLRKVYECNYIQGEVRRENSILT